MSYWNDVVQTNTYQAKVKPAEVNAYAAQYPVYEQTTPQYPQPSPYNLENMGYRANELVYACIQKRMDAVSEPPLLVYNDSGENAEELKDHGLRQLIKHPCEGVSEKTFWQISELYLCSAGFSAWEKERNRMGQIINLWPMRPDWCSFYRGEGRPIRAVRYQPYGLPPVDIPRENVLLFQYFDPIFPLLKGLSPVAVAMRTIGVDNATTDFLKTFFQQGTVISGLLSSDQSISDVEAGRIRDRWRATHGGVGNWGDIAVTGAGTKYQSIAMNFRDMAFQQLDGRDEARICSVLKVPPIIVGAKVGIQASTYSNYEQARKALYEETISAQWTYYQGEIDTQLLTEYGDKKAVYTEFDTTYVRALQENEDAKFKRGVEAAKGNILTRDEARKVMGFDPIDKAPVFVGATVRETLTQNTGIVGDQPQDTVAAQADIQEEGSQANDATMKAAQDFERRKFFQFAAKRRKEGHPEKMTEFKFKHLNAEEQAALLTELPGSAWRNYP